MDGMSGGLDVTFQVHSKAAAGGELDHASGY